MGDQAAIVLYGLAWCAFGILHSILAGDAAKKTLRPIFGVSYRLVYNLFAVLTTALVLWAGRALLAEVPDFDISRQTKLLLTVLSVAGWMFLFLGITRYDLGKFAGTESLRRAKNDLPPEDEQALITTGIHGYVRHPLYGAAILALWGAAWTPLGFWTAVFASAYLLVGAKLEERRLIQRFGPVYAEYRQRVPAFIPWRGRAITSRK